MPFFPALLSLLAGGLFLTLFRVPYWEIGSRFYKLVTYLSLVGWTLILLILSPDSTPTWIQFCLVVLMTVAGFGHLFAIKTARDNLRRAFYWTGFIVVLWSLLGLAVWPPGHGELPYTTPTAVQFLQFTLSAGILGSALNAMICGHWYLVNKYLSLEPIETISTTLALLIVAKAVLVSGVVGYVYLDQPGFLRELIAMFPVLGTVRIVGGIVFGWLLNWMAWKNLEGENTQAATGILYACITVIIMGEFSAYYITVHSGIAL